ncbi:alpha/beta hydrolase-fold protein [Saccharopolyspora sp. NPDC050389]|uniref:alpha/beta hydrolase-fold protein n=1 Tax=Saccharopolyspora sp. NPDC050389 TaxID=3155516 RepID=UPI0033CD783C
MRQDPALGGDPGFQDFLALELMPRAEHEFGAAAQPDRSIIAGQSFGGITVLMTAHRHPQRFGKVLSQSPSLWKAPEIIRAYADEPCDLRLHLSVVTSGAWPTTPANCTGTAWRTVSARR